MSRQPMERIGAFAVIILAAVVLRISTFSEVFTESGVWFLEYDPYYHMRRILYSTEQFPASISVDTYINYPEGFLIGWPPLFDGAITTLAILLGLGNPSPGLVETVGAIAPVLIGIALLFVVYYIADALFGGAEYGIAAAAITAILPAHVLISLLGFVDHHGLETLLIGCMVLTLVMIIRKKEGLYLWSGLLGVSFLAAVYSYPGSIIAIGMIGAILPAMIIHRRMQQRSATDLLHAGIIAFGSAGLISLVINILIFEASIINQMELSLFQPAFLFLLLGVTAVAGLPGEYVPELTFSRYIAILTGIAGGGMLGIYTIMPSLWNAALDGIRYVTRADPVLGTIGETESILFFQGSFTLMPFWELYTIPLFLAVFAIIVYTAEQIRERTFDDADLVLLLIFLITCILPLFQMRFFNLFLLPVVIWASYGMIRTIEITRFGERESPAEKKRKKKSGGGPGKMHRIAGVVVILLFVAVPTVYSATNMPDRIAGPPPQEWIDALEYLRDETPAPGGYLDLSITPEYGVMSRWDRGNHIIYIAERPVVANNFQAGIHDSCRFLTTTDEAVAAEILERRGVRYIITDQIPEGTFINFMLISGVDVASLTEAEFWDMAGRSIYFRLHHEGAEELKEYTMIYSTRDDGTGVRIFEYERWKENRER